MQWIAEQLGGVAPAALGALVGRLTSGGSACYCHFDSSPLDEGLLAILRGQLDRCGPEQLTCPVAAPCPPCEQPVGGFAVAAGCGALLGVTLTLLLQVLLLARGRAVPHAPAARQEVLDIQTAGAVTPAGLRRLRDGDNTGH